MQFTVLGKCVILHLCLFSMYDNLINVITLIYPWILAILSFPLSLSLSFFPSPNLNNYCYFCRGASQSGNSGDVVVKLEELRQHKEEIEREERELDEQCQRMKQCLKNITDDTYSDEYPLRSLSLLCLSPSLSLSLSLSPSPLSFCGYL